MQYAHIDSFRNHAKLINSSNHAVCVLTHQCDNQRCQVLLHIPMQTPHHAKIEIGQRLILHNHEISGMGISMEEALNKDLVQHGVNQLLGDPFQLIPRLSSTSR